jgi:hypothetical protein
MITLGRNFQLWKGNINLKKLMTGGAPDSLTSLGWGKVRSLSLLINFSSHQWGERTGGDHDVGCRKWEVAVPSVQKLGLFFRLIGSAPSGFIKNNETTAFLQVLRWLAFLRTVDRADLTVLKITELNGTNWTELNAARNRGTGTKKMWAQTKNINWIYLVIQVLRWLVFLGTDTFHPRLKT